jgi:tetratricopeptide (TPR) repeat protein
MIVLARLSYVQANLSRKDNSLAQDALANAREAFAIADRAAAADPANAEALSDVMATAAGLGRCLNDSGYKEEAYRILQRSVQAASDLVRNDPGNRENRLNLAISRDVLAVSLRKRHDLPGAMEQRRLAFVIFQDLSVEFPNDAKILEAYAFSLVVQGEMLAETGDWGAAEQAYRQALKMAEEMAPKNPTFAEIPGTVRAALADVAAHRVPKP